MCTKFGSYVGNRRPFEALNIIRRVLLQLSRYDLGGRVLSGHSVLCLDIYNYICINRRNYFLKSTR